MTRLLLLGALCATLASQVGTAWAGEESEEGDARPVGTVRAHVTVAQRFAAVRALELQADEFQQQIAAMERSARRFRSFMRCIRLVPVTQYGDPDHSVGFEYDELNGAGLDLRPALALNRDRRRWPDYAFLDFAKRAECQSSTTVPGGTADPAEAPASPGGSDDANVSSPAIVAPLGWSSGVRATTKARGARAGKKDGRVRRTLAVRTRTIRARVASLQRREERLEQMSERFDEWESCLSWVPVTEYGDPDGMFGYVQRAADGTLAAYRTAIAIDNSEWDDPDYEFLAFVGRDRPFTDRECGNEPGESVD